MREYGEAKKEYFVNRINGLRKDLTNTQYGKGIAFNPYYSREVKAYVSECREVVGVANTRVEHMISRLVDLSNALSGFYDNADSSLNAVDVKAKALVDKIKNVNNAIENLVTAVRGGGVFEGQDITTASVMALLAPVKVELKNAWNAVIKNNGINKDNIQQYISYLEATGHGKVTETMVKAYVSVFGELHKLGYSDEAIMHMTDTIFADPDLASKLNKTLDSADVRSFVLGGLNSAFEGKFHNNEFFSIETQNLSDEDLRLLMNSVVDTVTAFDGMSKEDRVDYMVKVAMAGMGYEGTFSGSSRNSFFAGCYPQKQGFHWCACFVTWMMTYSGLLNPGDSICPGVDKYNAIDLETNYWAGVTDIVADFQYNGKYHPIEDGYSPSVGDLIICHGRNYENGVWTYVHIGIIAGVDGNDVYTIEGNNNNGIYFGKFNIEEELRHPNDYTNGVERDVQGFCSLGGSKKDMDYMTPERMAAIKKLQWYYDEPEPEEEEGSAE